VIFTFFTPYSENRFKISQVTSGYSLTIHAAKPPKTPERLSILPSEILVLLDFLELVEEDDVLILKSFDISKYPFNDSMYLTIDAKKSGERYNFVYPKWVVQGTARVAFTILSRKEKLFKVQQELRGVI
jgi:hypothetical protein